MYKLKIVAFSDRTSTRLNGYEDAGWYNAFQQAYRIIKKGGTAIFSLLNFDSRVASTLWRK
ncbi:hypothetical protein [Scytonema sp. HK-05]|uniref:hypothetical protein n=1 Tax=Scytonema sp. HK-05 TaxID=1137095 RepID=UPI000ABB5E81|nr:hypothetical protein [Scytonema sp. HK-05]